MPIEATVEQEQREHWENLIRRHSQRLHVLEERFAILGLNAPPEVHIEIKDIQDTISLIRQQLQQNGKQDQEKPANTSNSPRIHYGILRGVLHRRNIIWFISILIVLTIGIIVGSLLPEYKDSFFRNSTPLLNNQVHFESLNDPKRLNPDLKWISGEGAANFYRIDEKPLIIHAGNETNQYAEKNTAPLVVYPIRGDFTSQVAVDFTPNQKYQVAGIGVRSTQTNYSWVRISREINDDGNVIAFGVNSQAQFIDYNSHPFTSNKVYLRVERRGQKFFLSYSPDGSTWSLMGTPETNYPVEAEIFLITLSTGNSQEMSAKSVNSLYLKNSRIHSSKAY
jgi:regulation of enolase protein 1 (concanavalin A-like superfamily)